MLTQTPYTRDWTRGPGLSPRRAVPVQPVSAGAPVPEWMTEVWKHRVEAEARHRLKSGIRGIAARR